jgi:methylenetetrahydrofolate dehydrogenase (NADP+)/methenyltetrahydrofolate cyclohydrolase
MKLLDGKKLAQKILSKIATQLSGKKPGLAFILVGNDPASKTYVQAKRKACEKVGIESKVVELSERISQSDLIRIVEGFNRDPHIHGLLVQQPLPSHISEKEVTLAIDPAKDVDGFHPMNMGKLLLGEEGGFVPCTPLGIQLLLKESKVALEGKHVVIVGRSNIVGKPLAALLMQKKEGANATVTIAHSQSAHLAQITRSADILISAVGKPHFIGKEMVREGAAVVDVGINRIDGKIVGDVDFENVSKISGAITPVPGGVGPMTIAMLMQNTMKAFLKIGICLALVASCQKKGEDPCTYFNGTAKETPYSIAIGKKLTSKEEKAAAQFIQKTFAEMQERSSECVDQVFEGLKAIGFQDMMIEWAGNLRASGHHPENKDWVVHINPRLTVQNHSLAPIPLRDAALSTCTPKDLQAPIAAATVIAPTCALAETLAHIAIKFPDRKSAEIWAQEVVDQHPEISFWILSLRKES